MRAGEGNRTPIFGLGSQRLSHWTTPASAESVTNADTLKRANARFLAGHRRRRGARRPARLRARLQGRGHDARRGRGQRRAAGGAASRRCPAAHRRPGLARRLQGQGRRAQRVGLVVRSVPRGGAAAPEDAREDRAPGRARARRRHAGRVEQGARVPRRSATRRSRACATATAPTGASSASPATRRRSSSTAAAGSRRCGASRSRRSGSTSTCRSCWRRRREAARRVRRRCSRSPPPGGLAAGHRGRGDVRRVRDGAERLELARGPAGAGLHPRPDRRRQEQGARSSGRSSPSTARRCSPTPAPAAST